MKIASSKLLGLLILIATFALGSAAQTNGNAAAGPLPFGVGETATYEAKISRIIKGIAVADLTFVVKNAADSENYLVEAEAKSKGTLLKLFRYSFSQRLESTIASKEFRVLKTVKHDVQKERVRDSEAIFDYGEKRVTYVESDPKEPMRPPRKIASAIENTMHDMISGIYSLRLMPLAVGKSFNILISDSGLVYDIPVNVTARERKKSIFGNVWCFRVEPDVFGQGRLIENEGSMIIWITDDARRLPIRSQVNASIGRIEIKLKSAKNLKS